jgi:hypothetical protein
VIREIGDKKAIKAKKDLPNTGKFCIIKSGISVAYDCR